MNDFIEVTVLGEGFKVLIPVNKILSVADFNDRHVFIETGFDKKGDMEGVYAIESYDEIKQKLIK